MAEIKTTEEEQQEKKKFNKQGFKEAIQTFKYITPYLHYFIIGMILLVLGSLLFMVLPYLLGQLLDIAEGKSELNYSMNQIGLGLIAILLVQGLFSYFRVIMFANVSERATADIRKDIYKKLVKLPITFFENNKSGELISRVTADVERFYSIFSVTLAELIRQVIIVIIGVVFLVVTTPRLALVMLLSFPVVMIFAIFFARVIKKHSKLKQEKMAESNSILGESIQSIQIVKAFANEIFEIKKYRGSINEVISVALKFARARAIFSVFIVVILFGAIFFVIYIGASMVQDGSMTAGGLVSFVTYTFILGGSIASIGNFAPQVLGAVGATERIREILNTEDEIGEMKTSDTLELDIKGDISFINTEFYYPSRTDIQVLNGINIDIAAGTKAAIVGPSGVGKSTILQLLLRFYEITGGQLLIDGKSINEFDIRSLRNNMSFVPQEVILFGGSIRENILYGDEHATEEAVIAAAKKSNSWEFISNFLEGLDTLIGERGVKLSGGQRQRIAIARAILKNPAILLLDEATSALDSESEKVVQEALKNLMEGRTSIIIAHRLSTIADVDCIYVLDDGKIIERGKHEELMQIEDGAYRKQAVLGGLFS